MHGTAQKTGPRHKERWNQYERAKKTHRMGAGAQQQERIQR